VSGAVASTLGRLGFGAMAGWENDGNSLLESRGKPWKALESLGLEGSTHQHYGFRWFFFLKPIHWGVLLGEWPSVANHNKDMKPTGT